MTYNVLKKVKKHTKVYNCIFKKLTINHINYSEFPIYGMLKSYL